MVSLFFVFDALGNHCHVQTAGEVEDGFDDGATFGIGVQALDEGAVDFEGIELQVRRQLSEE